MTALIEKYFTGLTERQLAQIDMLDGLYHEWNAKINVISRKDIDNLYEHHVLHSLAICKQLRFRPGTRILDFGTGGGFPGIPLAIMFPECHFRLIDGTGKKINVVKKVAMSLGLDNVDAQQIRGEEERGKYNFVVSRAVMKIPDLMAIVKKNFCKEQLNSMPNGLIYLKGGNVEGELRPYRNIVQVTPLSKFFDEDWFKQDKYLIYIPC